MWVDIFAVNQDDTNDTWSAMVELDDGRTLERTIKVSQETLLMIRSVFTH